MLKLDGIRIHRKTILLYNRLSGNLEEFWTKFLLEITDFGNLQGWKNV